MQRTRGMFTRIPENVLILAFRGILENIPGSVREDSGECSRRFQGMLLKIPGNAREDCGECSRRLRGMFKKIPKDVQEDSGNVPGDSGECSRRLREMSKKIDIHTQNIQILMTEIYKCLNEIIPPFPWDYYNHKSIHNKKIKEKKGSLIKSK